MEYGVVPAASIAGMAFSFIIAIVLPIVLLIAVKVKYKAQISTFFIGLGVFIFFAMILEQIFHVIVIGAVGQDKLTANVWVYALYGAAAAAAFEETGRFFAMKLFMRKRLNRENAFMYGIGHGGGEAMIIVGITCINNIATSIAINTGLISATMSLLDEETKALTFEQISQLWTLPPYQFFMAGVERISAITIQIVMTFFIYKGVKSGKKYFIASAYGIHFIVDFLSVVLANFTSIVVVEVILLLIAAAGAYAAYIINKDEVAGADEIG